MEEEKNKRRYCSRGGCPRAKLYAVNWLEGISGTSDFEWVEVSFKNTRVGFYRNENGLDLKIGDIVAVEGNPGHDIGRVTMVGRLVRLQMAKTGAKAETENKKVYRIATNADMEKFEEARSREHDTMIRTRKIAEELNLDMKIGDVEYQGDGAKAIFYYIADERVDFRKLIRILADTFKVRIEMKQIGARQEAGRIGGIGPCGRPLCCSSWMTHFVSVGTGAARLQDLSMNPQKLAGQCGKLKCCINFETDVYAESQKQLPPRDAVLQTKDSDYYWFKPDILARTVTYSTDKRVPANLVTITAKRALEVLALNKQGIKVDKLSDEEVGTEAPPAEYGDLLEQESLTRFDAAKRKKAKKKPSEGKKPFQKERVGNDKSQQRTNTDRKKAQREKPRSGENNAPAGKPMKRKPGGHARQRRDDRQEAGKK